MGRQADAVANKGVDKMWVDEVMVEERVIILKNVKAVMDIMRVPWGKMVTVSVHIEAHAGKDSLVEIAEQLVGADAGVPVRGP